MLWIISCRGGGDNTIVIATLRVLIILSDKRKCTLWFASWVVLQMFYRTNGNKQLVFFFLVLFCYLHPVSAERKNIPCVTKCVKFINLHNIKKCV